MCGQYDDLPLGKRRPWAARGPMLTGRRGQKSSTGRAWEPRGGVAAPACGSGLGKFPGEVGGDAPAGLCERILLTRSRDTEAFEAAQCGEGTGCRQTRPDGAWRKLARHSAPQVAASSQRTGGCAGRARSGRHAQTCGNRENPPGAAVEGSGAGGATPARDPASRPRSGKPEKTRAGGRGRHGNRSLISQLSSETTKEGSCQG